MKIFTVCNVAYLQKVFALAQSLYETNNLKLQIVLFDKKRDVNFPSEYCEIFWIEDFNIEGFNKLAFKYTVIELTTALKPTLALHFLKHSKKVIFLDPDTFVYNNFKTVFDDLDVHPVIVTPHYLNPKSHGKINDQQLMRFGSYNLGFFAVNNSEDSFLFLNWWEEKCLSNCFDDPQFGVFTDQKWVTLAKLFFDFIHVTFHSGLNVAYWNLEERLVSKNIDNSYHVNDMDQLIFIHFSSFDKSSPDKFSKHDFNLGKNKQSMLHDLSKEYLSVLNKYSNITLNDTYSYDYFDDGIYISPTLRRAYNSYIYEFSYVENPFCSDEIKAFAKKNYLFEKHNNQYRPNSYNNVSEYSLVFKIVFLLMRLFLRFFGPNKLMSLSRLFVYLSRFHDLKPLWKK